MNSTITLLWVELFARQPGGGGGPLDVDVYVAKNLPFYNENQIVKIKNRLKKNNILDRKINSIFEEIGASSFEDVSFDKIKSDRLELDKIIMGEILGLTNEEQLDVYKAVVDLVKSRLDKAKTGKKGKNKNGIDRQKVMEELKAEVDQEEL